MRETELFDGAFASSPERFDLSAGGQSEPVDGAYISGRLFEVLGVAGIRGRMLTPADDGGAQPDGPVAVISHRLWQQRFAGEDDVVGRQLTVQRIPFTIVGVMPPGFFGPDVGLDDGRHVAVRRRAAHPGPGEPVDREGLVVAGDHGAAEAGTEPQSGERRAPGHPDPDHGGGIAATEAIHPRDGRDRQLVAAPPLRNAASRDGRRRGARAARRVRHFASLVLARTLARRREFSVHLALGSSRGRIARLLSPRV